MNKKRIGVVGAIAAAAMALASRPEGADSAAGAATCAATIAGVTSSCWVAPGSREPLAPSR